MASALAALALSILLKSPDPLGWVLSASVVGVFLDIDHLILQLIIPYRRKTALEVISNPLVLFDTKKLIAKMHYPGFGILRMKSHLILSFTLTILLAWHPINYSTPVIASLWVHCLLDATELIINPNSR